MSARPDIADHDGHRARALALWSVFDADGEPTDTDQHEVVGTLYVDQVEALDYWRVHIDGVSIDRSTITLL